LPYLGGERTPHNNANARGVLSGLGHTSDQTELTKAVLQGVAFAFLDSLNALASTGTTVDSAYAIGGGSRSRYWLQMISSVLQIPLHVTADGDYGASLGAARLGMIASNASSPTDVFLKPPVSHTIEPDAAHFAGFHDQYQRFKDTYKALYA
jgi:xylulokinase